MEKLLLNKNINVLKWNKCEFLNLLKLKVKSKAKVKSKKQNF